MSNQSSLSLAELNYRIAILQDNIRQLVEQAASAFGPGLMAQAIDLRNQLDPLFAAGARDLLHFRFSNSRSVRKLWPRLKIEIVVKLENERVHSLLGQHFPNELS